MKKVFSWIAILAIFLVLVSINTKLKKNSENAKVQNQNTVDQLNGDVVQGQVKFLVLNNQTETKITSIQNVELYDRDNKEQNIVIQNDLSVTKENAGNETNYAQKPEQWTAPDIALNNLTKVNIEQITMNAKVDIKKLTNQLKC